jgi:predicted DsbA family dithiol-disulfide isomerase
MRAAAYALEQGRGGAFIIAAGRLAFSGGFDLDDPDVLMEAAAAAGVPVAACLEAAADQARDASMEAAAVRLRRQGVDRVPALRVEGTLLWGEETISAYLATGAHRAALAAERTPLTS